MTPGQKLDTLLEGQARLEVAVGRIDREVHQCYVAIRENTGVLETMQDTLANVLEEVKRHGQKVAPATSVPCAHDCEAGRR
jgi:hypothetical protein